MPTPCDQLPENVLDALRRDSPIEAIKLLREATGLGLKDAKDIIDAHRRGSQVSITPPAAHSTPLPANVVDAMQQGKKIEAIKLLREQTGLGLKEAKDAVEAAQLQTSAPGVEVPGSGRPLVLWLILLAAAGATAYLFLRSRG